MKTKCTLLLRSDVIWWWCLCATNAYIAVVVYCHSEYSARARFLFGAQDKNMTNGDFAFFTFTITRSSSTDRPWTRYGRYVDDPDDLPRRQRAFHAVKQVLTFAVRKSELSKTECNYRKSWRHEDEWKSDRLAKQTNKRLSLWRERWVCGSGQCRIPQASKTSWNVISTHGSRFVCR